MNEYTIINNNQYNLKLLIEDNLDYYTDLVLKLSCEKKELIIFKDNILYLINIIKHYTQNIDSCNLDLRLEEKKLGILFNEYYYFLHENKVNNNIIMDSNGRWIGEKYCCFYTFEYVTWIYKIKKNIFLKVTPIFQKFDEDNNYEQYLKFTKNYRDSFKIRIKLQDLHNLLNILTKHYQRSGV